MMAHQNNLFDYIQETMEADKVADALDAWLVAEGKDALADNEQYGKLPEYQLTPRMEKRLARALTCADNHSQAHRRLRLRILLIAALLVILLTTTYASAIRAFIGNYFLNFTEESIDFSEQSGEKNNYATATMPSVLPNGFIQASITSNTNYTEIIYANDLGEEIRCSIYIVGASVRLDSEDADEIESIEVGGQKGVCIIKGGQVNLFWGESPPCQLQGSAKLRTDLIQMAESMVSQPEVSGQK